MPLLLTDPKAEGSRRINEGELRVSDVYALGAPKKSPEGLREVRDGSKASLVPLVHRIGDERAAFRERFDLD